MNKPVVPSGLYHFLCGVCAGVFLMLSIYNEAGLWALWATACVVSMILSGFFRPCMDVDEVKHYLRLKGFK